MAASPTTGGGGPSSAYSPPPPVSMFDPRYRGSSSVAAPSSPAGAGAGSSGTSMLTERERALARREASLGPRA